MTHTPKKARALWCPMVRHSSHDANTFNRGMHNFNPVNTDPITDKAIEDQKYGCHCIADKCAMWRWVQPALGERDRPPTSGYCGLAGRPEFRA